MKINYKQLLATLIVMALLLLAQTLLADPLVEQGTTNFTAVSAEDLTATDDLVVTDDASIGGALDVTGALGVTGSGTVGDDLTVGGAIFPSFLNLTVTNGSTLTPAYTVYALDSGGAVTMTLAATGTEGQMLILIGDDDNAITINDTNVRTSDGNSKDIGVYDIAVFIFQDSEWLEMLLITNS